jgi:hypothetical protein
MESNLKKSEIRLFCDNDKRWGNERPPNGWYDKTKYAKGGLSTVTRYTEADTFRSEMVTKNQPSCQKKLVMGRAYERRAKAPSDRTYPIYAHHM